jgi:hypothetical protein
MYNQDRTLKKWKMNMVNAILPPSEEVKEEMAFSVTEESDDEDEENTKFAT